MSVCLLHPQRSAMMAIALGSIVTCVTADAQQPDAQRVVPVATTGRSCLDTISESRMHRVVVYASPTVTDSVPGALVPSADNFTQLVVDRVRVLLNAKPDTLPRGEPTVTWRGLGGVTLTAYRDGRIDIDPPFAHSGDAGFELLSRAIRDVHAGGDAVSWPDGVTADSFQFKISLISPIVHSDGKTSMPAVRIAVPLFSVAVPPEEEAVVIREGRTSYPETNQRDGATGYAIMQFVVDTNGRADMSTVRDRWPANKPQLTGSLHDYYVAFVQAAQRGIATTRFRPAQIGGCSVKQLVQKPYSFSLSR